MKKGSEFAKAKINKKNEILKDLNLDEEEGLDLALDLLYGLMFSGVDNVERITFESYGASMGGVLSDGDVNEGMEFSFSIGVRASMMNKAINTYLTNNIPHSFDLNKDKKMC